MIVVAFRGAAYRLLRGATVVAIAAAATAAPGFANAAGITCAPLAITINPPIVIPPALTAGTGSLTTGGPVFSPPPDLCVGFTTTNLAFTSDANPADSQTGPAPISIVLEAVADFTSINAPNGFFFGVAADGGVAYSSGFVLTHIILATHTDALLRNPTPPPAFDPQAAVIDFGSVPSGHDFSNSAASTVPIFPPVPIEFHLQQLIELDFLQLPSATSADNFVVAFPDSIVSVILPTPEPGSLVLLASALGGLAVIGRRKRHACHNRRTTAL